MANIKIELDYPLEDGMSLTFKAPCDCTAVTGIKVYYPEITETTSTTTSKTFSFRDAHLNALTSLGNLFAEGATVKVVLDTVNSYAFIQNADTNGYLEDYMLHVTGGYMSGDVTMVNNAKLQFLSNNGIISADNGNGEGKVTVQAGTSQLILDNSEMESAYLGVTDSGIIIEPTYIELESPKISFSNKELQEVADPTKDTSAATKKYVDTGLNNLTPSKIGAVPTSRKVNGKALSADVSLTASDVGALPLSGGMMTGNLYAFDDSDPSNPKVRNSLLTDTELNDSILVQMPEGCIAWLYE